METVINRNRLFLASCLALVVTSMTFAIRARLETVFGVGGAVGADLSLEDIGNAFAPAFWGFTVAMIIGGPLVDSLGMKRIIWAAFFAHIIGIIGTIMATGYTSLFWATVAVGIGNGFVEAACNPLVASMYTTDKPKMLNRFHVWFPGGIVVGSLIGYLLMDQIGLSWQVLVATLFIPLAGYGILFFGQQFPQTERVEMGVSTGKMWSAVASPLFLFIAFCMLLTSSTELGTQQRISSLLGNTVANPLLVLALTTGVMAVGRLFAGPIVHRISIVGVLLFSAVVSFLGLWALSTASGGMVYLAALVFGIGVTFFWPTMISFVAEHIPESGALGLSIMGGLGMFATAIVLPIMGKIMDDNTSGAETLQIMSILPAILIVLFTGLYFYMRSRTKTHSTVAGQRTVTQ